MRTLVESHVSKNFQLSLAEAVMALKGARTRLYKNPNGVGDLAPRTIDTTLEPSVRPGQPPESKKKESPYYYGNHSGTFHATGGQPSSSNHNGRESLRPNPKQVHFVEGNGNVPHQDPLMTVGGADAASKVHKKVTSTGPGAECSSGTVNVDDSSDSTFEIPLDEIYALAEKGKEKPKNDGPASRSRPAGLSRSESHRHTPSNSTESSVLKSSSKVNSSFSEKSSQRQRNSSSSEITKDRHSSFSSTTSRSQDPRYRKSAQAAATTRHANRVPGIPVTGVASAFYCGGWLPADGMSPYSEDIAKLNKFLKNCRSEVEAGVPGRWLTVVMGNETADLDSMVSSIAYAFFLGSTGSEDQQFFVPVLNMRREDFALRTEAVWLFECTGVDVDSLIFVDQISLSYFHRFGSLKLILVDHSRLAPHQENLQEAVVEIVDHNVPENLYPWVSTLEIEQVGSCATIIAERYAAEAPQLAAGRGLNRLLLATILMDTNNLEPDYSRCTSRDECMAAFLLNGAGRYGRHGLYRLLRKKKYDVSGLTTKDTMRRDFKQWTLGPGETDVYGCKGRNVAAGMSTLGMALYEFLRRDAHILNDIQLFRRSKKLDVLIIITGYYDNANHYKREFLVAPEDEALTRHLTMCFKAHSEDLKLSPLHIDGLPKDMLAYIQGNITASRKTIRSILAEFFSS